MPQAIFCDFYGTLVHENGPQSIEVVKRVLKNSAAESANDVLAFWGQSFTRLMQEFAGERSCSQIDLARISFQETIDHFEAEETIDEFVDLMVEF